MRRPIITALSVLALTGSLTSAGAAGTIETITTPASVLAPAERINALADVVTIFNKGNAVSDVVFAKATAAGASVGAAWALGRGATIGLRSVRRANEFVKLAPSNFQYPLSITALPTSAVGPLMGVNVAAVLGSGQIVMSVTSSQLNGGVQVGDVVDLIASDGLQRTFTVGMIAPDSVVGGTELVVTPATADQLGLLTETRIVLWGFPTRSAVDAALVAQGLTTRSDTRIRRSWDAVDPDLTLGLASTKALLGEFAYNVAADDTVTLAGNWVQTYLPPDREVLLAEIPIRARCNLKIRADLIAALTDVYLAGLAGAFDLGNTNTYGGCFNARFNRLSAAIGSLSRHSWGGALDANTVTNAQGAVPTMNCGVVRIFRKHNFAWGGNFLTPDGMHFEWVGTRRDQFQYPSAYCPNLAVAPGSESAGEPRPDLAPTTQTSRATLFADDGWAGE